MTDFLTDLWHLSCAIVLTMVVMLLIGVSCMALVSMAIEMKRMLGSCSL